MVRNEIKLKYKSFHQKKRMNQEKSEELYGYLFILVPLLGFLIFTLSSVGFSFYQSFTDYNPLRDTTKWVWFQNYIDIFKDSNFVNAIFNTVLLLASIPLGVTLGLFLAIYLKHLAHGRTLLMLLYYLPAITSSIAIIIVFKDIFNNDKGLINAIFNLNIAWIGTDTWLIKIAIVIKNTWAAIGGTMILYLAGLNNIPDSYYEASRVAGASRIRQFFDITLPMTDPTTFYLLITGIIVGLQSYADAQIFGNGNAGSRTVVYYIWYYGISNARYGYASAASVFLAIVILVITIIQFKKSRMFDNL